MNEGPLPRKISLGVMMMTLLSSIPLLLMMKGGNKANQGMTNMMSITDHDLNLSNKVINDTYMHGVMMEEDEDMEDMELKIDEIERNMELEEQKQEEEEEEEMPTMDEDAQQLESTSTTTDEWTMTDEEFDNWVMSDREFQESLDQFAMDYHGDPVSIEISNPRPDFPMIVNRSGTFWVGNDKNGMPSKETALAAFHTEQSRRRRLNQGGPAPGDFCWRTSYGRGIGVPLTECPADKEKIGALCYTKCPAGMKRFGFDCVSMCPDGWRDDGLFCANTAMSKGRGAGYAIWAKGTCDSNSGGRGCEKWGAMWYPKCENGYKPAGCCICAPAIDCSAHNLGGRLFNSCMKRYEWGNPSPMKCAPGMHESAGLCYHNCRPGFSGYGPMCWAGNPPSWVDCGMGAAKNSRTCALFVGTQIYSGAAAAGEVATLVVSFGTSAAAMLPARLVEKVAKIGRYLMQMFNKLKTKFVGTGSGPSYFTYLQNLVKNLQRFMKLPAAQLWKKRAVFAGWIYGLQFIIRELKDAGEATDAWIIRMTAQIASLKDPTGFAAAVASFAYDTCDKVIAPSTNPRIVTVSMALGTSSGRYVSFRGGSMSTLSKVNDRKETWTMTKELDGKYSFETTTSPKKYLSVNDNELSDTKDQSCLFVKEDKGSKYEFYLKHVNGENVRYLSGANGHLTITTTKSDTEVFHMESPGIVTEMYYIMSDETPSRILGATQGGSTYPADKACNKEQFYLPMDKNDKVSIQSFESDKFFSTQRNLVEKHSVSAAGTESFEWTDNSDGSVSFHSNNQYVQMNLAGSLSMSSSPSKLWLGQAIQSEKRGMFLSSKKVRITTVHHTCLSGTPATDSAIFKHKLERDCGDRDDFEIVHVGDENTPDSIALRTHDNTHISCYNYDGIMNNTAVMIGEQEKWQLVWHSDGRVSFKCLYRNTYLGAPHWDIARGGLWQEGHIMETAKFRLNVVASKELEPWAPVLSDEGVMYRSQSGLYLSWNCVASPSRPSLSKWQGATETWMEEWANDNARVIRAVNYPFLLQFPDTGSTISLVSPRSNPVQISGPWWNFWILDDQNRIFSKRCQQNQLSKFGECDVSDYGKIPNAPGHINQVHLTTNMARGCGTTKSGGIWYYSYAYNRHEFNFMNGGLRQVQCANYNKHFWGTNSADTAWYRAHATAAWQNMGSGFKSIAVDESGAHVYAVKKDNSAWYRHGAGGAWKRIDWVMDSISPATDGSAWGVSTNGLLYYRWRPYGKEREVYDGAYHSPILYQDAKWINVAMSFPIADDNEAKVTSVVATANRKVTIMLDSGNVYVCTATQGYDGSFMYNPVFTCDWRKVDNPAATDYNRFHNAKLKARSSGPQCPSQFKPKQISAVDRGVGSFMHVDQGNRIYKKLFTEKAADMNQLMSQYGIFAAPMIANDPHMQQQLGIGKQTEVGPYKAVPGRLDQIHMTSNGACGMVGHHVYVWYDNDWLRMNGGLNRVECAADAQNFWGIGGQGDIWYRFRVHDDNHNQWQKMNDDQNDYYKWVSVADNGWHVYAITTTGRIRYRQSNHKPFVDLGAWDLEKISSASDGSAWGVSANGRVWYRQNFHKDTPWYQVQGEAVDISAMSDSRAYILDKRGEVYFCPGIGEIEDVAECGWERMDDAVASEVEGLTY